MNKGSIESCLPPVPNKYRREVTQVSPLLWRVDLIHPPYSYTTEEVRTVWGFIMKDKVYRPKDYKTKSNVVVASLNDAHTLSPYTSIIPEGNLNLLDLL